MPSRGPNSDPCITLLSADLARASARSPETVRKALRTGLRRSIRSRIVFVTSTGDKSRERISCRSSRAEVKHKSILFTESLRRSGLLFGGSLPSVQKRDGAPTSEAYIEEGVHLTRP